MTGSRTMHLASRPPGRPASRDAVSGSPTMEGKVAAMDARTFMDGLGRAARSLSDSYLAYRGSHSKVERQPAPRLAFTGPVVVRTYRARNAAEASVMLAAEAQIAYAAHYTLTAQSWAPGSWGAGAFILALLLILAAGFGLLVLAYLVIVKPAGTLTATFTRG